MTQNPSATLTYANFDIFKLYLNVVEPFNTNYGKHFHSPFECDPCRLCASIFRFMVVSDAASCATGFVVTLIRGNLYSNDTLPLAHEHLQCSKITYSCNDTFLNSKMPISDSKKGKRVQNPCLYPRLTWFGRQI